jgi:murein DD-endopeptidase MepM/ murein hydrolase activator NlpD
MPMYGTDYFLNSVVTSSYWLNMQANRTLDMINAIYDIDLSTFSGYVTNMYGTYSVSADGAHEGIDFAYGSSNTDLHAIFDGVVKKYSPSYHFSVYDSSVSKTYTYYHNNSVESSFCTLNTVVDVGDHVTNQGNLGGTSTGVHLHFEVHSGNTTSLSPGNDDVLSSISPYQMNIYIP